MIRIGIVDDHTITRHALRDLFSHHVDLRVEGEGATAAAAVDIAPLVDVLVLDLMIPGDGLNAITEIQSKHPAVKIVALSGHPDELYGVTVIELGARGYVSKLEDPSSILEAVRKVAAGGKAMSARLAASLREAHERRKAGPGHAQLSPREMEVFRQLAKGSKLGQVALEMKISVKTASTYRKRVLQKLVLDNNQELTRYAIAHHLIT